MTIAERNRVLAAGFMTEIALTSLFAISAFLSLRLPIGDFAALALRPEYAWEPRVAAIAPVHARALAVTGALCLWSLAWGAWILRSFRKTTSYEVLFLAIFAASMAVEGARGFIVLCAGVEAPSAYAVLLSRAVYAGRWAGVISFFAASLYAVGFEHEKAGRDIAIVLFLSVVFASVMPINSGSLMENFLLRPGYPSVLDWTWIAVSALSLVDYGVAAFLKGSRDYALMGAGASMAIAGGRVLLSLTDSVLCAAGLALLAFGTWILMRSCFRRALWQ